MITVDDYEPLARAVLPADVFDYYAGGAGDEWTLADVAAASEATKWWQLYVFTDRELTLDLLHRVHAAGFGAVCLTVDFPDSGLRHRDTRSGFQIPIGLPSDELTYAPDLTW